MRFFVALMVFGLASPVLAKGVKLRDPARLLSKQVKQAKQHVARLGKKAAKKDIKVARASVKLLQNSVKDFNSLKGEPKVRVVSMAEKFSPKALNLSAFQVREAVGGSNVKNKRALGLSVRELRVAATLASVRTGNVGLVTRSGNKVQRKKVQRKKVQPVKR